MVVTPLPETGFKVFKGRRINSLLNTTNVSKKTRTCNCVGTVVLTQVLKRNFQLLHAHLKHYLQTVFNAHQRTQMIEVLSPLFGWACGVSHLCWTSSLLHSLWSVLRVNSRNTGSVLQRAAGGERPRRNLRDSAQLHWEVSVNGAVALPGHMARAPSDTPRRFCEEIFLDETPFPSSRPGWMFCPPQAPGWDKAGLFTALSLACTHTWTCTHRAYLFVVSYNPL